VEQDPAGIPPHTAYRISDLELAARSLVLPVEQYSGPDEPGSTPRLQEHFKEPAALERQVRRMLADPRSHTLVSNFASQWLPCRNPGMRFTPDMRLFPDFDDQSPSSLSGRRPSSLSTASSARIGARWICWRNYTYVNETAGQALRHPACVRQSLPGVTGSEGYSTRGRAASPGQAS